jgi:penicillin-binding protein 2
MIEAKVLDPQATFRCQGYFHDPDRLRCQIYRQHGIGHADVALADALAQSCNVYFFHHAIALKSAPLVSWAARFGIGQPTGVEIDDEPAGLLPDSRASLTSGQTQLLSIGQGPLAATPLQIVRLYAAIANGGLLVTPRLTLPSPLEGKGGLRSKPGEGLSSASSTSSIDPRAAPIPNLSSSTLATIREGLARTVNDPNGTAYDTVRLPWPIVAGKTGTAETGGKRPDHAWFAGYAPADAPRYAFVVVLEHGGSGSQAAGSIARQLVLTMRELGYYGSQPTAQKFFPPGKG